MGQGDLIVFSDSAGLSDCYLKILKRIIVKLSRLTKYANYVKCLILVNNLMKICTAVLFTKWFPLDVY